MAKMTGFIWQDDYLGRVAKLSDQELGRLVRALSEYHVTGETQELAGRESIAFDFIKADIDRIDGKYIDRCETNKAAVAKRYERIRTNTNEYERIRTNTNVYERIPSNSNSKDKEKDNLKEKQEKEKTLTLTEEEIRQSLKRDEEIEAAARNVGLQVTGAGMKRGIDLANEYGLENTLKAIGKAVDSPRWSYVEGILRNEREGKGKPDKQQGRKVTAQMYTQRNVDYEDDGAALMEEAKAYAN